VVAGTSAGSVVGALYASGMDAFALQKTAFGLDEAKIRDVRLFSGGLVQGLALQDYVNQLVHKQPIERLKLPFAAVATELETGTRTVFGRGNTGRAVRASCSIPGVFEPVEIHGKHYVDGGVVSPIPVDAARQLGADFVIAVDISAAPDGSNPQGMMAIVGQSIDIMGRQLAAQESARADVVIRPDLGGIGPTDFEQKNQAILAGEKAALAPTPAIGPTLGPLPPAREPAAAPGRGGARHALLHLARGAGGCRFGGFVCRNPSSCPSARTWSLPSRCCAWRWRPAPSPRRPRWTRASSRCLPNWARRSRSRPPRSRPMAGSWPG
jgi:NTE family protein